MFCPLGPQFLSRRARTAASKTPSQSASQVLTAAFSLPEEGIKCPTGLRVSAYSTITRESYITPPSSITNVGTLHKGFKLCKVESGFQTSSTTKVTSIFFSKKAILVFLTNGLAGVPINFIITFR